MLIDKCLFVFFFFFQAEDGIRDATVTGVQTCALPILEAIRGRFAQCHLELHPTKTRIVYCKDDGRPGEYEHVQFDFLGYTFQPRLAKNRWGKFFVSFLPAISTKAAKAIRKTIRD